jgi:hypothetical protein
MQTILIFFTPNPSPAVFQDWTEKDVEEATHKIQFQRISLDHVIWKEGEVVDPVQYFPIIKRGEVQVLKSFTATSNNGPEKQKTPANKAQSHMMEMCVLGPKAVFVERSMIDQADGIDGLVEVEVNQSREANSHFRRGTCTNIC